MYRTRVLKLYHTRIFKYYHTRVLKILPHNGFEILYHTRVLKLYHTRVFKYYRTRVLKILPHKGFKNSTTQGFWIITWTYLWLPAFSSSPGLTLGCQLVEFWEGWKESFKNSDLSELSLFSLKVFLKLLLGVRFCIPVLDEKKTYAWCSMQMLCNAWLCTKENVHALGSFHLFIKHATSRVSHFSLFLFP